MGFPSVGTVICRLEHMEKGPGSFDFLLIKRYEYGSLSKCGIAAMQLHFWILGPLSPETALKPCSRYRINALRT